MAAGNARSTRRGADRRALLVRAAFDGIAEKGFEGLRLREVAARAGIDHSTLHHYFPTRQAPGPASPYCRVRTCGYAAVRAALHAQRQGLRSNRVAIAGTRAWFRACKTLPPLKALNLPYRSQARPRAWERSRIVTTVGR